MQKKVTEHTTLTYNIVLSNNKQEAHKGSTVLLACAMAFLESIM